MASLTPPGWTEEQEKDWQRKMERRQKIGLCVGFIGFLISGTGIILALDEVQVISRGTGGLIMSIGFGISAGMMVILTPNIPE